jgi:hypothetical protein
LRSLKEESENGGDMKIETYEIEEGVESCTPEQDQEALALIEKLGLDGQKTLVRKTEDNSGVRFQYPEMTAQENAVYSAIFPQKTHLKTYSHGVIPVRVLQVAAHASEFCDTILVWHKKVRDPDPLLVGIVGPDYSPKKIFRLARWGEALKDFKELIEDARVIIRTQIEGDLKEKIAEAQKNLGQIDALVEKKLVGEPVFI